MIRHFIPRWPLPATIKRRTPPRCGSTERIFSNKQNVKLGCVTQKKSFDAKSWGGSEEKIGGRKSESEPGLTYLSNIGLKLMPLSVAICYFYCLWLCIIFAGVRTSSGANFNFYAATQKGGGLRFHRDLFIYAAIQALLLVLRFSSRARFSKECQAKSKKDE